MKKRLYCSKTDRKLCGVCGGLGDYFNIDPVIIRVIWAVLALCYGTGVLLYIVMAFAVPKEPDDIDIDSEVCPPRRKKKYEGPEIK